MPTMAPKAVRRGHAIAPDGDGVRARLLKASHELFTERGYRATTTKEIAARAGVAEPTLFRHLGSKVEAFEASILIPLKTYIQQWSQSSVRLRRSCGAGGYGRQLGRGPLR